MTRHIVQDEHIGRMKKKMSPEHHPNVVTSAVYFAQRLSWYEAFMSNPHTRMGKAAVGMLTLADSLLEFQNK
jgi:hypothetical protein